jgi:hypothetical protein
LLSLSLSLSLSLDRLTQQHLSSHFLLKWLAQDEELLVQVMENE